MARRAKKKGRSVSVDWSDAEIKNYVNREGEYLFKVTGAEEGDDGQIIVDVEVINKIQHGRTLKIYFNTGPKSLWFLGKFLEATGTDIPDSEEDLDLDALTDLEFVGVVKEHEWDDKTYMRVRDFMPADDFEGEMPAKDKKKDEPEEEEDEPEEKPKRGRKPKAETKKKKAVSQSDIQDMDQDELEEFINEHELDVDLEDFKTLKKMKVAVIDAGVDAEVVKEED